ncbi:MAG TPA: RNase H family protein [Anaerolineae bacterium]|nr:RNase H family protein [Anaerolineae bacterium]
MTPVAVLPADVPHLYIRISCRGNPGPGGWGVVVVRGDEVVERGSGGSPATTNNRLELTAVIAGLRLIPQQLAVICTTSDYLYQGATKWIRGWRKRNWRKKSGEEIANGDLWTKIDMLNGRYPLRWSNVKGEELAWLEEANQLANQEAEEMLGRAT